MTFPLSICGILRKLPSFYIKYTIVSVKKQSNSIDKHCGKVYNKVYTIFEIIILLILYIGGSYADRNYQDCRTEAKAR